MKKLEMFFRDSRIRKMLLIMRITFLLLIVGMMHVSASVYSQNAKLKINMKNASFAEILEEIKEQSEFNFLYRSDIFNGMEEVDLKFNDVTLEIILDNILVPKGYEYEIDDNVVIIRKSTLRANNLVPIEQTKIKFSGTVTDEDGNPVPFAAVVIKGTTTGTATDVDGRFEFEVEPGEYKAIVASSVGFISHEIAIEDNTSFQFVLRTDISGLEEVVVTGYQTISKERSTGAFVKVNEEVLEEKATLNVIDKLEGLAPGVLFDENGNITIRGISSMNAETNPLIVVDGFPLEGDLESINPNDVESMTILKDAAAASIWGARASNGVIVITTKRGKGIGKVNVDFSSTLSITPEPDLYSLNRASSESFIQLEQHMADNGWSQLSPGSIVERPFNEGMLAFLQYNDGQITKAERDATINRIKGIDVRDEYANLFLQNAMRQQYHLAVSGASERSNYYASVGYDDYDAWLKGSDNDRFVSNLRIETKFSKRISFNAAMTASIRNQDLNGGGALSSLASYQQILDENGNYVPQPWGYAQSSKDAHAALNNSPYDWTYNMYQEYENKNNALKTVDLRMQAGLNINILKGLDFEGRYQYEWGNQKGLNLYNENTYYVRNQVNMYAYPEVDQWTGATVMEYPIPMGEIRSEDNYYTKSFTTRGQLNFNRSFDKEKHRVYAIAGIEVRQAEWESSSMKKFGYDPVSLQYGAVNYNTDYYRAFSSWPGKIYDDTKFDYVKNRYASYYANAGYTLNDKYTATASVRLDDSNLFGASKEYRNVPLWSAGANWHMHKEDFMTLDFVSRLTLRATYGTGGNIDRSTSPYLIADVAQDWQTQTQFAYIVNPSNPNLRWEKTSTANIGFDYGLFNNRVSGSLEYYNRQSVDLLGAVSLNAIYGFDNAKMNFAEMSNKGVDFAVNVGILTKDLKWNAIANFSYNKNNVEQVELTDESVAGAISPWGGAAFARVGKPLYHIYSYRWAGLSAEGMPQIYNENNEVIDHYTAMEEVEGLQYEGSLTPKYYGSLQNLISYKGFRLSSLITYKLGHVFRVPTVDYSGLAQQVGLNAVHSDFEKRWQQEGDEANTNIPVIPENPNVASNYWGDYTLYGSHNVQSASHIRFKDVVLSYDLPRSWLKSIKVQGVTLGAQVRNLGVITFNDAGLDPENMVGVSGYGDTRPEYTFSLKASF